MTTDLEEKYSRDPTDYERSDHFLDALAEEERHFHLKDALTAIRHGDIQKATGNAEAEWVLSKHGVKVYVLVGYDDANDWPVLITGWPAVHDPRQAVESGRWTEQDLREIHIFNDGDGDLESAFEYP